MIKSIIRPVIADWLKQYLPVLLNSACTAVCLALAGCRLTADNLAIDIDYPATYHSTTNSPH